MSAPSAAEHDPAEAEALFSFTELEESYRERRRRKRGTANAMRFEENLEENLLDLAEDLRTGNAGGYSWVFYRRGRSEYLRAMAASYLAHFSHANTARLRAKIGQRFPWLRRALTPHAGGPFWDLRRAFPCLAAQVNWLDNKFPGCLLAFQVGTFWELYGRSALVLARALKLQLLHGRRRALQPWIRVPMGRLALVLEGARKAGIRDIVLIAEEGGSAGWVLDRRAVAVGRRARDKAPA